MSCVRYADVVFHNVEMVDAKTGVVDVRDFNIRMDVSKGAIQVGSRTVCIGRDCMVDFFFVFSGESFTEGWCFCCCRRSSSSFDFVLSQSLPVVVVVVVLFRTLRSVSDTLSL